MYNSKFNTFFFNSDLSSLWNCEVALALVFQLWTRDQIDTSQCNLSFHLYTPRKYHLCSTWFFHHNNYKHFARLTLTIKKLLRKGIYLSWIIVQFKLFYKIQYIIKWSDIRFWYVKTESFKTDLLIGSFWIA